MPVSAYFKGNGDQVMASMKKQYGPDKGENVFYATANAKDQKPKGESSISGLKAAASKRGK